MSEKFAHRVGTVVAQRSHSVLIGFCVLTKPHAKYKPKVTPETPELLYMLYVTDSPLLSA